MAPQVVLASGQGKAFQVVAQAAAIAVQDAGDALRAVSTIAATASAAAMARFLATGDEKYLVGIATAQEMVVAATDILRLGRPDRGRWYFATFRGPVQTSDQGNACIRRPSRLANSARPARSRRWEGRIAAALDLRKRVGRVWQAGLGYAAGNCG